MVYKEWRRTRLKFAVVLIIYILAGVVISTLLNPANIFTRLSIFHQWVIAAIFITIGGAILAGSDSIAEETGKNTLSFLLTRPLSRANIYTIKFVVNAITLSAVLVMTSVIMFFIEQLPQGFIEGTLARVNGTSYDQFYYVAVEKVTGGEALGDLAQIFGLGVVMLALTTLVSIFCQSTIEAIIATLLLTIGPLIILILIAGFLGSQIISPIYVSFINLGPIGGLILLGLAAGIYVTGLRIFKSKEF